MKENNHISEEESLSDIAIIGMSCRFPGAKNIDEFWQNLVSGKETIQRFTQEELLKSGESEDTINNDQYVNARGIVSNPELFDASFFGFSATDARLLDPQHRFFLECGWEALESAGYASDKCKDLIGVYASMAESTYLQDHILKNKQVMQSTDWLQLRIANSLTTLSTQLSYRLNLKGPSVNITTACSSSLVTIITACKALIDYDCDLAIAGASVISIPQHKGYVYQKGGIESVDGHCRTFDADATGTVFSDGVGVVVLKRLSEAVRDRDFIYATIKSWNINNDGADKAGYAAPSVRGQARCIVSAANFANIDMETIRYIETHGTGTIMGDPIEINALKMAFETQTNQQQFCALGSVKTNIGHADIAAGMAGIIKTALILKHKQIPASLHYKKSNPAIDFKQTPFYVNAQLSPWESNQDASPRRAGINSSGIGGTNAFLILEENRRNTPSTPVRPAHQLILISAKTSLASDQILTNLLQHVELNPQLNLQNLAYTLQIGRADFAFRQAIVCDNLPALLSLQSLASEENTLQSEQAGVTFYQAQLAKEQRKIVFMFPGQGSHYSGMCDELYHSEPGFSRLVDECLQYLNTEIQEQVSLLLFGFDTPAAHSQSTLIVQPALFIFEYALGKFLMNLGITPDAMVGHSIGEYVAACLSGVMSCKTALHLIQLRATLMEMTEPGHMVAIPCNEDTALKLIQNYSVSIAACNTPSNTVISGACDTISALEQDLATQNIVAKHLNTSHAFHSSLMTPILEDFARGVEKIDLQHLTIPFISNISGEWAQDHDVTNPEYWVNHIQNTVRFRDSLDLLLENDFNVFLEVGPGQTLTHFIREISKNDPTLLLRHTNVRPRKSQSNKLLFLKILAELWLHGATVDWHYYNLYRPRSRLPLPTYPFQRQQFWVAPSESHENSMSYKRQPYTDWFYEPSWKRTSFLPIKLQNPCAWIIFNDDLGISQTIQKYLLENQHTVFSVTGDNHFLHDSKYRYNIDIANKEHYQLLMQSILSRTNLPLYVINLLPLTAPHATGRSHPQAHEIANGLDACFYSSLYLTQALIENDYSRPVHITLVGNELFSVLGETVTPVKSTVTGPCRIIPLEHEHIKIKVIDIIPASLMQPVTYPSTLSTAQHIIADTLYIDPKENFIAFRENYRWIQSFSKVTVNISTKNMLRDNRVLIVTGGLGGIALTLVNHIAQHSKNSTFILLTRSSFPSQSEWETWLQQHPEHDPTVKKILRLQSILKTGAQVKVYQANVADTLQLTAVISTIKTQFGSIHGVIHSAGNPGGGLAQFKTKDMASKVFEPKVFGTYLLCALLKDEPLDFFILCSSISSVVGEASQIDYCAANACLDAFPNSNLFQNSSTLFTSINWNTWQEIGMAVETERPANISYFDRFNDIKPEEGVKIFSDALSQRAKQLLISTLPLDQFIEHMRFGNSQDVVPSELVERHMILPPHSTYQPPRDELESLVAQIWQEIFSIDKIGVQDDFFMLGGHSLTALHLLNKIERQFKVTISVSTFLEHATTIEQLAKVISSGTPTSMVSSQILIPIRSSGKNPPLFCFHPVAGTIFCYANLAKHLKYDAPIYGIQDPSIANGAMLFDSMEDMAACYIKEIKKIQGHGPYYLGGLSFGATLAAEAARQLRLSGDTTQMLFFFDGWAKFSDEQHIEDIFKQVIGELYGNRADSKILSDMAWQRMRILLNYDIKPIQEPVFLYKAQTLLPEYIGIDDPYNYWKKHVSNPIHLHETPGTHETILDEPNIQTLAALVDNMLHHLAIKEGVAV